MRHHIALLVILLGTTAFGQPKDRRPKTPSYVRGFELSVLPDGKMGMVESNGDTYFTKSIDSSWHSGQRLSEINKIDESSYQRFQRISFFNKDTAIVTGNLSAEPSGIVKNGYYLTMDGGKTWKLLDYGGESWAYSFFNSTQGNAWMGGWSRQLFFSQDFGQSWRIIKLPFKTSDRTYSIYMRDAQHGIIGSENNEILRTDNNWKTAKRIPTPLDQKRYHAEKNSLDNRFHKTELWGDYMVVNQKGLIFYSELNKTNWKRFPINLIDFEVDNESQTLFAITSDLHVVRFASPTNYYVVTENKLTEIPRDIKVANHSLYILTGSEICKVNDSAFTCRIPFSTDYKIPEPKTVKKATDFKWGFTEDHLYVTDRFQNNWYEEAKLDFHIKDLTLLNDSVAILWDGSENHIYSLAAHSVELYPTRNPLKAFLASPVQSFVIRSTTGNSFNKPDNEVIYTKDNRSAFKAASYSEKRGTNNETLKFENIVSSVVLDNILKSIDTNPEIVPSLKDFKITKEDLEKYLTMVGPRVSKDEWVGEHEDMRKIERDKAFYLAVPDMLDTMTHENMAEIIGRYDYSWNTTKNWLTIHIANKNGDTLNISRRFFETPMPWHLPWKFEYKGLRFICYNVEFSRFIESCLPDKFPGKEAFDNSLLIMTIADYLWDKEK